MKEFEKDESFGHIFDENIHLTAFILTLDKTKLEELRRVCKENYGKESDDIVHFIIHLAIDQYLLNQKKGRIFYR